MGTFDTYNDSPNAIKNEGQEISLKFDKTSPTTGRISWNIPPAPQGCSSDNQAYNGIIITLDTTTTNIKKSPVNGTVYVSDNTVDKDLHAGDKLDTSIVIGDFYNDKTTTFLDINGLLENESYYISGYAVDKQNRYHSQGIHAYSIDLHSSNTTDPTQGCQTVHITDVKINPTDLTNLTSNYVYDFGITWNVEDLTTKTFQTGIISTFSNTPSTLYQDNLEYNTINIDGNTSQTYQELVDTINLELKKLENPFIGVQPPNTNGYYWNTTNLYQWNGYDHIQQQIINEDSDPTVRTIGDLWFDTILLNKWDGVTWNVKPYLNYYKGFDNLDCTDYWFNGTNVYNHDGNIWCSVNQYVQTEDPSVAPSLDCGSFWYDEVNLIVNKLSKSNVWVPTEVLYWNEDPNNLTVGTLWFNDLTKELKEWNGIAFDLLDVSVSDVEPAVPILDQYWFNNIDSNISKYDGTVWNIIPSIISEDDPTSRESCEVWWNSTTNDFFLWDVTISSWALVPLIESAIDPISVPYVPIDSIWINSPNGYKWDGMQWNDINLIYWPNDPTILVLDDVWFDGTNWYEWDGSAWILQDVIESINEPTGATLPLNTIWFNSTNNTLQLWNGLSWIQISYSTVPLTPDNNALWLDSNTNDLKEWYKGQWNDSESKVTVSLTDDGFKFCSSLTGHESNVILGQHLDNLFQYLVPDFNTQYSIVYEGTDGVSSDPLYQQIGVGDDGSPEERRELVDAIRHQLGYPTVEVELTKQQLDYCVDAGIEEIRKRVSSAYKRGFFFLDVNPGQQRYILSHKGNGFNKIVSIQGIYRTTSSFLRGFDNGVFGQTAVNFLYNSQGYDLVSYHLYSSYVEELENLFATKILYQWNEQTRALDILQSGFRHERMLMDVSVERTEQDLITDRFLKPIIENWALAQSMILLSQIRGKYGSLPGANGISLNAGDLYAHAQDIMLRIDAEIDEYVIDLPEEYGLGSTIMLG